MSNPQKRPHEEAGHTPPPSKRPLEDHSSSTKPTPSGGDEFHRSFEPIQDGRLPKIQRVESHDEKRLQSVAATSLPPWPPGGAGVAAFPAMNVTSGAYPVLTRLLESKGVEELPERKVEDRDKKIDARDAYADVRTDPQVAKSDNSDAKLDARIDEHGRKPERRAHPDYKGADTKFEKEGYPSAAVSTQSSWKEGKEHQKGKRHSDSGRDSLVVSWHAPHVVEDVTKTVLPTEERVPRDPQENVGDSKMDVKGEEKLREKDKKRKDEKYREFQEREKERNDRRGASIDKKEPQREEERKEILSEKDAAIEKEKELGKKELLPIPREKEQEKVLADGALRNAEQQTAAAEVKAPKDDTGGMAERDSLLKNSRRREEADAAERHDQKNKCANDKESDDGCGEGDTEKDNKEVSSGVQQRKRIVRPRGTPQSAQREPRPWSKLRDSEGSQGKPDTVTAIVYKAGECMQELLKSWMEYEATQDNKSSDKVQRVPTLEIRIPAEYVTSTNRQVKGAQLWGTDVYTNDSDLVAVLMHTGYCCPTSSPPPSAMQELRATIRVLPPQECYTSTLRNNVRSRAWGAGSGCSFCIDSCCIVKKDGGTIELEPCLTHTSAIEPTLAPVSVERTMTTRAAASNALRQQRFVREVTIQYNLCNEPWLKYSIGVVADKGLKRSMFTSARLKKGEVIYLETHRCRYELCFSGEKAACNGTPASSAPGADGGQQERHQNSASAHAHAQNGGDRVVQGDQDIVDVFRWSRCKKPMTERVMRSIGIPLPLEHLEVLEENVDWEDIQWSQTGVWVAGKEYTLARVHFLSQ